MSDEKIKKMATLLRRGASLLSQSCPQCGAPLFKIKDEIFCPSCEKKVVIVKEGEQNPPSIEGFMLSDLSNVLHNKLREIIESIKNEKDPNRLEELLRIIAGILDALERLKRISR
ncbi:MAG: Sjogren's syndrome/scleroderma autoantigen 1 family protein [Candidatus Jordarchaeaceae archaeon]